MTKPYRLIFLIIWLIGLGILPSSEIFSQILKQTFSENLAQFRISTPNSQWKFKPRSITPGPVRATLRFESPVNKFVPNVTVRVLPLLNPKMKLAQWVDKDLGKLPPTVEVREKKEINHLGHKGYEVLLYNSKLDLMFMQWIFLAKEKSFVITCTAKKPTFDRFSTDFKMILNSFEII